MTYCNVESLTWAEKAIEYEPGIVIEYYTSATVDYGARDEKGRKVGGYAVIESVTPQAWKVRVYSARDGQKFGAIPRATYYDTLDEAKHGAARSLNRARKRALKKQADRCQGHPGDGQTDFCGGTCRR